MNMGQYGSVFMHENMLKTSQYWIEIKAYLWVIKYLWTEVVIYYKYININGVHIWLPPVTLILRKPGHRPGHTRFFPLFSRKKGRLVLEISIGEKVGGDVIRSSSKHTWFKRSKHFRKDFVLLFHCVVGFRNP